MTRRIRPLIYYVHQLKSKSKVWRTFRNLLEYIFGTSGPLYGVSFGSLETFKNCLVGLGTFEPRTENLVELSFFLVVCFGCRF